MAVDPLFGILCNGRCTYERQHREKHGTSW
jgi:hypothetical protein